MREIDDAIAAASRARVAVLAFRGVRGEPMALPVTPYVDGDQVIVTSTLVFVRKAELIRRDGRVAMLAAGTHITGDASVFADVDGDVFTARYLDQELTKYAPGRAHVEVPDHRKTLSWYFGRAIIVIEPRACYQVFPPGDACTVARISPSGYPTILPVQLGLQRSFEDASAGTTIPVPLHDGAVVALIHRESDDMSVRRHVTLRGRVSDHEFHVESRSGTLSDDASGSVDYVARERRARAAMRDWPRMV